MNLVEKNEACRVSFVPLTLCIFSLKQHFSTPSTLYRILHRKYSYLCRVYIHTEYDQYFIQSSLHIEVKVV